MLLSGLVHIHIHTDRQTGTEGDRERESATADTFVSTHVGADINNSINCCTPKFCQRQRADRGVGAKRHPLCFSVVIDLQACTIRSYQSVVHLACGLIAPCVVIFGVSKRLSKYD